MPLAAEHAAALVELVGGGAARNAAELAALDPGIDPHNFGAGLMLRPAGTGEVARVLVYCNAAGIGVVPQGGRTGLAGGAVSRAGEVILSLDRLDRIESLDAVSRTAVAGAGVTLAALARLAAGHGLSPGIDFGARDSATVGGMISTNAGGLAAFRHGTMRERVLGLEVVLADGTVLNELAAVRKRNEGLAVQQLFIGAEGTLGVITRACLALIPEDGPAATALVAVRDLGAAVALCDALLKAPALVLAAIEIMSASHVAATSRALGGREFASLLASPYVLLVEATAVNAAAAEAALVAALSEPGDGRLVAGAVLAQSESQRQAMWRVREDWAVDRERPGGLWYDVSVPLTHLPDYLNAFVARIAAHDPALAVHVCGHLGDGNVHLTVNAARPIGERYEEIAVLVTEGLAALGGSFSAEHGIGLEKKATFGRVASAAKLALVRRVKATLDPRGIMNPGKVLSDVSEQTVTAGSRHNSDQ